MNKIYFWFLIGVLAAAGLVYALQLGRNSAPFAQTKMQVVATFYPLAHFATLIGGEYAQIIDITPAGAEPHDYEPTPKDIMEAYQAKVFLMNGGGLDAWAEKIVPNLQSKGVLVVDMERNIQFTSLDSHIWLDPMLAQQEVQLIANAFAHVDPLHKDAYEKNASSYIAQLQTLESEYQTGLASCKFKDIVVSHAAFGYLAKRYGFNQVSLAGLSPDAEPSAQQLAHIAQFAKENHIGTIFFETLLSPKLAKTLAGEVGSKTLVLNPLEGLTEEQIKSGKTYITEMENNLANLRIALQCT